MKTAVIYNSQTGFTKRYAHWIAKSLDADCVPLAAAKHKNLDIYGTIIFGSWACAGGIRSLSWFKRHMNKWADKKLIIFCVGACPIDSPEAALALRQNFENPRFQRIKAFYCPGGLNYKKMPAASKFLIRMFRHALKVKKSKTKTEEEMLKTISSSYDISDKKYIQPIIEFARHSKLPNS